MAKRKQISKKIRFEVFKRDSFKCQYCGASAPETILEVDHIHPVSKGGDNDILNLITSCHSCNNGKSNIELDDNSALEKQKTMLDELNAKRQQLEMLIEWRQGLKGIDQDSLQTIVDAVNSEISGSSINENGERTIKKWLKKYPLNLLLECIDISSSQYLKFDDEGGSTNESFSKFFSMVPRIAHHKINETDNGKNTYKDAFYARGILRNRLSYVNEIEALNILKRISDAGYDMDEVKRLCREVRNWTQFKEEAYELLEGE